MLCSFELSGVRWHRQCKSGADAKSFAGNVANPDANTSANPDAYTHSYADADANSYANPDADSNANPDADSNANPDADPNTNPDADPNTNAGAGCLAIHSDSGTEQFADVYRFRYRNTGQLERERYCGWKCCGRYHQSGRSVSGAGGLPRR